MIDIGDIIYNQPQKESFCNKIESVPYKAALAIAHAIQGTSCNKLYQGLGLESLKLTRRYKRLCCMYTIMTEKAPDYLINMIQPLELETTVYPLSFLDWLLYVLLFLPATLNDLFFLDINIRN